LQELESWKRCFYWKLPVDGVGGHFLSATAAGEVRDIALIPVKLKGIGATGVSDSANIERIKKVKRLTEKMKTTEKKVLP
jgi:hypothetical protein